MAFLYPRDLIQITLQELATLSVADDKDVMTLGFDAEIFLVRMYVGSTGDTGGSTDAVVEATPSGGSAVDLWTVGSGVGRIAYDGAKYLEFDRDDLDVTRLRAGTSLALNVNAIPTGTASDNLVVHLYVYPTSD